MNKQDIIEAPSQPVVEETPAPISPVEEAKEELAVDEDIDFLPGWLKK